jgi:hypothetical protein
VLALVLVSGGLILLLAALVLRPDESHGPADAAVVATEHDGDEQTTEGTAGDTDEHAETAEGATGETDEHAEAPEDTTGETDEHADTSEVANSAESESAHDDQQSDTVLGVDMESLNLSSPRLAIVLIGLTILLAIGLVIWQSTALLVACVGLGLAGAVVGMREALQADEELGIFVPLPVLASVLYLGAACLAGLALISSRGELTRQERSSRRRLAIRS